MSDWTPVHDGLPVQRSAVICYDEFYDRVGEGYYTGRKDDHGCPRFVFVDDDDCHITHWMPMPESPKQ